MSDLLDHLHPRQRVALPLVVAVLAPLAVALVVLPWRTDVPGSAAALVMVAVVVDRKSVV